MSRLKLAAALALGTVTAVPTVLASSEVPNVLATHPGSSSSSSSGSHRGGVAAVPTRAPQGASASAAEASAASWSLSRVLEDLLAQLQLLSGGSGDGSEADALAEAELAAAELAEAEAVAVPSAAEGKCALHSRALGRSVLLQGC
jgi:hypothetical protein